MNIKEKCEECFRYWQDYTEAATNELQTILAEKKVITQDEVLEATRGRIDLFNRCLTCNGYQPTLLNYLNQKGEE